MNNQSLSKVISCLLAGSVVAMPAIAQQASGDRQELEEVVVRATKSRIPDDLQSTPGSVTIISAEEIADQAKFSNDLGELLQRTVPGFGVSSSGSYSNFSQTLRGRKPAVFIDGVPTTVPLRDGGRDVRLISPGVVGRVDVVRGATALYGLGGAGGLINYATIEPGDGPVQFRTDFGTGFSLNKASDSLNWSIDQSASGKVGGTSFVLSGFYESYGSLFDADGKRLPPNPQNQGGISDTDAYNLFGKVGWDIGENGRLFLSANIYSIEQDSDYSNGPGGVFGVRPTPAIEVRAPGVNESTENSMFTARYDQDRTFAGDLSISGYYSSYEAIFPFFPFPNYPPNGGQSLIEADRYGARIDVDSALPIFGSDASILWGIDYAADTTSQPLTDGRVLVPKMDQTSIAPFFQFQAPVGSFLNLRGGARWENAEVEVDTFTTIPLFSPSLLGGVTVRGGKLEYDELLFNFGAVLSPFQEGALSPLSFFAGYSEGFSVGDFGRALRATTAPSIEAFDFQAQIVESTEVGVRYSTDSFDVSLVAYRSESEFGSSFNAVTLVLLRAPEEVEGLELAVNARAGEGTQWGGSVSWSDGEVQNVTTGVWSPLDTSRIQPTKANLYVDHEFAPEWQVRVQATVSGRQSRFPGNPTVFGRADIEGYTLVDASISGPVGPGRLTLAISNLLNEEYFTPDAFRFANANQFTRGQGAAARLSYSIQY